MCLIMKINVFNSNNRWIVYFHRLGYTICVNVFHEKAIYWQPKLEVCMRARENENLSPKAPNSFEPFIFVSVGINIFRETKNIKQ